MTEQIEKQVEEYVDKYYYCIYSNGTYRIHFSTGKEITLNEKEYWELIGENEL